MKRLEINKYILLAIFLLFISIFSACASDDSPALNQTHRQPMTAYLLHDANPDGWVQPRVRITVPINNLVFIQKDEGVSGGLEVQVVAWLGTEQAGGAVSSGNISFDNFDDARSDSLFALEVEVPLAVSQDVMLEVRARSLESSRFWVQHIPFRPSEWKQPEVEFSNFSWNSDDGGFLQESADSLIIKFDWEIMRDHFYEGEARGFGLSISENGSMVMNVNQQLPGSDNKIHGTARVSLALNPDLNFGQYQLWLESYSQPDSNSGVGGPVTHPWLPKHDLVVLEIGSFQSDNWKWHLHWLDGWLPEKDIQALLQCPAEKRMQQWEELWQPHSLLVGKGLTQREHLEIILEADRLFAASSGQERGALSDRGKAWIRYGKPDFREYRGNMQGRYRRWEIWHYNNNADKSRNHSGELTLTFLDSHGLNEYRLIETQESSE